MKLPACSKEGQPELNSMKSYCINLDKRSDRWEECRAEFSRIGLSSVQRVSARMEDTPLIDCAADHASCVGMSLISKDPMCLIMEDDVQFITPKWSAVEHAIAELQQNDPAWDMLFLGINADQNEIEISGRPLKLTESLYRIFNGFATHAYIVRDSAYNTVLDAWMRYAKSGIPHDVVYSREVLPKLRTYCVNPLMALQRPSYSQHQKRVVNYDYLLDRWRSAIHPSKLDHT
jgi:GR25 family glycosyltransferase involved in LPS biosynthesis